MIDENYPILPTTEDEDEEVTLTEQNESHVSGVCETTQVERGNGDAHIEDIRDLDDEPSTKRRAAAPHVVSMLPTPNAVSHSLSPKKVAEVCSQRNPIVGTPKPVESLALPSEPTSRAEPSLPPLEKGRTSRKTSMDIGDRHLFSSASHGTPQSSNPFPNSSIRHAHTPQMHPSPYSFRLPDPTSEGGSSSSVMGIPSYNNAAFQSSPLARMPDYTAKVPAFPPRPTIASEVSEHAQATTFVEPPFSSSRRGSASSIPASHSFEAAHWKQQNPNHDVQLVMGSHATGRAPNTYPMSKFFNPHGHSFVANSLFPPLHDRRLSLPLPPTGMFTVPVKPKASKSPNRKVRNKRLGTEDESLVLKRLLVTGKNGVPVVDHQWSTPQRIPVKGDELTNGEPIHDPPPSSLISSSASMKSQVAPTAERRASRSAAHAKSFTALLSVSSVKNTRVITSDDPKSACVSGAGKNSDGISTLSSPGLMVQEAERNTISDADNSKKDDRIAEPTRATPRAAARPIKPQRCVSSNTSILGVQGPKAATFWLEDPEEMLREAARLRRSRSPLKHKMKNSSTAKSEPTKGAAGICQTAASSPLSTVPTTPKSDGELVVEQARPVDALLLCKLEPVIPQLDGSTERKPPASASKTTCTPSPARKLNSTTTPRLASMAPSTPKPSPSPNTKKRKAAALSTGRYLAKQPRSPDRLKTVGNPPLNQNCVIAFAESEDKESEMGVLRQIRGERQGVFAEEYIVLATRFFVASN